MAGTALDPGGWRQRLCSGSAGTGDPIALSALRR